MARLPVISGDEFVKAVAQIGFTRDRTRGSHMILIGPAGRRLTVPRHRELGRGLLRALIRDAGLTRGEFTKHWDEHITSRLNWVLSEQPSGLASELRQAQGRSLAADK